STNDQQTLAMQNRAMREYAARRGWTIALQVREVNSGAVRRKAREKLIEAARRREIDVVLVWRLDRWGRSVTDLLATLQELEHLGLTRTRYAPGREVAIKISADQFSERFKRGPRHRAVERSQYLPALRCRYELPGDGRLHHNVCSGHRLSDQRKCSIT